MRDLCLHRTRHGGFGRCLRNGFTGLNFEQGCIVFGMGGFHPHIPPSEIEAIVSFEVAMVHVVVGTCVEPFAYETLGEPTGIKLVAKVAHYVFGSHNEEKGQYGQRMHGYSKHKHDDDAAFYH